MGLTEYKRKRAFEETPEPTGGKPKAGKLAFVVQKHAASRLHYDFRLEMDGVLKSWAVPKGPSLRPGDKRLAMMVEDHPFDYKNFEGVIPEGNYGAGTVIIWDHGTYEALEGKTKKEQERALLDQLENGSLKFRIHGEKLHGEFALVKMKGREENSWLLIKHRDKSAEDRDVTEEDRSVVSNKTLEELSSDGGARVWNSNRSTARKSAKRVAKKAAPRKTITPVSARTTVRLPDSVEEALKSVREGKTKAPMPKDIKPMLATLIDKPFEEPGWLYEVKWDGFRAVSYLKDGNVEIRSRNNKDFTKKFYPLHEALSEWGVNAVVDGEVIVINDKGKPDFNALQEWRSEADGQLIYYLFDILWLEGYDLMNVPIEERKRILKSLVPDNSIIRISETFDVNPHDFFRIADEMGLEGIVAKKAGSAYKPDSRSKQWAKIKTEKHQEAVIAGYTQNENSKKPFSALLLGVYDKDELVFVGPVGTGFTIKQQEELLAKMNKLQVRSCPFNEEPDYNKPSRFRPNPPKASVTWLRPKLVAEIAYRSIGSDGGMRHPSFRGLREDKDPKQVVRERALSAETVTGGHPLNQTLVKPAATPGRKTLLNPTDETQVRKIDGHELKFPNLSKVYWPEEGYTKRDMLNYYYQVAPLMLPYMKDRPQTLNRFPNGIHGKSFYQKDVTGKVPSWLETYQYFSEGDQREKHFLVCTDEASLLYIAALGCIEMNPWSSRTATPDHPDWCVIDLDPDRKNTFEQVIEAACVTKSVLDTLEIPSYCKTSGSTGMHIYVPLGAQYTYEESKEFGRAIVKIVHSEIPDFTSIERKVSDRKGKMYLDFLQNRPQATLAGPYSLRPKPGAPVSMPLHWDEVRKGLAIRDFTIRNAMDRLRETGDLFQGVLGPGIDLAKAMKVMKRTFAKVAAQQKR